MHKKVVTIKTGLKKYNMEMCTFLIQNSVRV